MTNDAREIAKVYKEHRVALEGILFDMIQKFSGQENMTADSICALAAATDALVNLQKAGLY